MPYKVQKWLLQSVIWRHKIKHITVGAILLHMMQTYCVTCQYLEVHQRRNEMLINGLASYNPLRKYVPEVTTSENLHIRKEAL